MAARWRQARPQRRGEGAGGDSLRVRRKASICCAVGWLGWLNVACAISRRNWSRERRRPACIALGGEPPPLLRVDLPTAGVFTACPLPALLEGAGATGAGIALPPEGPRPRLGARWRLVARSGWLSLRDGCQLCFSAEWSAEPEGWEALLEEANRVRSVQCETHYVCDQRMPRLGAIPRRAMCTLLRPAGARCGAQGRVVAGRRRSVIMKN